MPPGAIIHTIFFLLGLSLIVGLLASAVICVMKGKWVFFALGWFSGVFWIVGACRLAKPGSRWATGRYGDVDLERAQRRFANRPLARLKRIHAERQPQS